MSKNPDKIGSKVVWLQLLAKQLYINYTPEVQEDSWSLNNEIWVELLSCVELQQQNSQKFWDTISLVENLRTLAREDIFVRSGVMPHAIFAFVNGAIEWLTYQVEFKEMPIVWDNYVLFPDA